VSSTELEAARQQALLRAIAAPEGADGAALLGDWARVSSGLQIYRGNADALAERALAAGFPTLHALLGPENFKPMARAYRRAQPPRRGDIGEWGESLPDWLRGQADLAAWPYLGDCAALDWLRHCCERAADADFDAASLALLESHDPALLWLRLRPGVAVLESRWLVASIHAAHQPGAPGFEAARAAIAAQLGECVLVARTGWRAVVHTIDAPTCHWTRELLAGASLDQALARAAPSSSADFDFTAWLGRALANDWLQGVELRRYTAAG
jgi:Putative DNA-binding domain